MRTHLLASILLLFSWQQQTPVWEFAFEKLRADPHVRIEDGYKWVYQATRGNGPGLATEQTLRHELRREWASLGQPLPGEEIWEPLRADEKIGRLNLRPFRARGGNMENLLAAFLQSAKDFPGDQTGKGFMDDDEAEFHISWNTLGMTVESRPAGKLNWPEWRRLDEATTPKHYPAINHSAIYEQAHHPSYRLVTKDQAEKLKKTLK